MMQNKNAQIAGQIFIYIIAVVVVGFIILYGYSAIRGFSQRGEEVEYISMRTSLASAVKGITSDYGSISRPDVDIPGKYEMVCFVDKSRSGDADNTALCSQQAGLDDFYQPIACSGWKTGRDNVFLIPDGSESFDVGNIVMLNEGKPYAGQPFMCFEVSNNQINLQLAGLGDKVEVSEYS